MSVRYKLVLRKDLSKDAAEGAQKYYASVNSNGMMTFQQTCTAISAYSTASPGDVKVVMDGLLFVLKEALLRGEVVQLGELGNFQINVGSSGTPTTEEFKASMIRKPRIVFRPSVSLKEILGKVNFERINAGTSGKDDSGVGDRPEIE